MRLSNAACAVFWSLWRSCSSPRGRANFTVVFGFIRRGAVPPDCIAIAYLLRLPRPTICPRGCAHRQVRLRKTAVSQYDNRARWQPINRPHTPLFASVSELSAFDGRSLCSPDIVSAKPSLAAFSGARCPLNSRAMRIPRQNHTSPSFNNGCSNTDELGQTRIEERG